MAILDANIQHEISQIIENAKNENSNGNSDNAYQLLIAAWDLLPEPKGVFDDSYHIVKYITQVCMRQHKYDLAKTWVIKIYECDLERYDSGEREYLHAKILFAMNELDEAAKLFKIANVKSEGRYPLPNEKEYLNLILK